MRHAPLHVLSCSATPHFWHFATIGIPRFCCCNQTNLQAKESLQCTHIGIILFILKCGIDRWKFGAQNETNPMGNLLHKPEMHICGHGLDLGKCSAAKTGGHLSCNLFLASGTSLNTQKRCETFSKVMWGRVHRTSPHFSHSLRLSVSRGFLRKNWASHHIFEW